MSFRPMQFLAWLLVLCSSQAQEPTQWTTEFSSGIFTVHCDFELEQKASLVAEMNSVREDLRLLLEVNPAQPKIHIVLFGTESEYRRYMDEYFPGVPQRRAIFIQHRGPGMLFTFTHNDLATDLRHEVTHALVNRRGHVLPLWLDEGLGEYFEVARNKRFAGNQNVPIVAELVSQRRLSSIEDLARVESLTDFSDAHYRDAWAWVHFMIHRRSETRALLIRYLRDSPAAMAPDRTSSFNLQRAIQEICPELEKELVQHFGDLAKQAAANEVSDKTGSS